MQLRQWRKCAELTQQQLANLARVSRAAIAHLENGYYPPSAELAGNLAAALSRRLGYEVRVADIFDELRPAARRAQSTPLAGSGQLRS